MRPALLFVLLFALAACTGQGPGNNTETPAPIPSAGQAENRAADNAAKAPENQKPPATRATRPLGSQKLAGSPLSVELELPWQEGDAPAFRARLEPGSKLTLLGWMEDQRGERLSVPARLLLFEGAYRLHPVMSECPAGNYFLVISTATGLGAETARFPVRLG